MGQPARKPPAFDDSDLPSDDPFRLGFRERIVRLPGGRTELRQIPLTADDLLDPQLGDHVTQNSWHNAIVVTIYEMLSWRYESRPDVLVTGDLKMMWGIPGLPNPSPDVAVIPGVRDKARMRRSFKVRREGTRPAFVLEVVSDEPEHQSADHHRKVEIYERAGISEYLILDPPASADEECRLSGFRLNASQRYEPIPPDAQGRILSDATGLWFAPHGRDLILLDVATGERILTASEARGAASRMAEENARLRAELARLKAGKASS
jgi:Uma2 family endonuclease